MSKYLLPSFALILALGCAPKKGKVLKTNFVSFGTEDVLDPALSSFAQEYFILDNMAIKLVGIGEDGVYANELANKIQFSQDKKTIEIELKKAKFSDGTSIKAMDVAKSLKRAAILGTPHTNIKGLWLGSETLKTINDEIPGIVVNSDTELTLKLTSKSKEILYFLSMADLAVLHPTQYEKPKLFVKDWLHVTSGAYVGSLDLRSRIKLVSNPHYQIDNPERPIEVLFNNQHGKDLVRGLENRDFDLGFVSFNDYINNSGLFVKQGYHLLAEHYDGVVYINLNPKSEKFKNPKVRRKVLKLIYAHFSIPENFKKAAEKANQFFLPEGKGFASPEKVADKMNTLDISDSDLSKALNNILRIDSIPGMVDYLPKDLAERVSQSLGGINVELNFTTPSATKAEKFLEKRDYDAYVMAVGMSSKVLGEALNLQYLSNPPKALDPSGRVKSLLKRYQNRESAVDESNIINEIILQMIEDAELVPLYYFTSPFTVNTATISSTKLNLRESVKFAKIKMM